MTAKSDGRRRRYSLEEKLRAVAAYHNRGDRPVQEIVEELGISSQAMLYLWLQRERDGALVETRSGPPKGVRGKAKKKKRATRAAYQPRQQQLALPAEVVERVPAAPLVTTRLSPHSSGELTLLRAENVRLRKALSALLVDS